MDGVKIIRIGLGEIVSNWGSYEGKPALYLEPATVPGVVGKKVPADQVSKTEIRDGGTVIVFHSDAGARVVLEDIHSALGDANA